MRTPELIRGRSLVLDEESFKKILLEENLTQLEAREKYGVSHHITHVSREFYREKYGEEIRKAKSISYARDKFGNKRGSRPTPSVVLDKEKLLELRELGKSVCQIAKELETTEFLVKRNLGFHRVSSEKNLPKRMQGVDLEILKKLEVFVPGLVDSAGNYYEDPTLFFNKLYEAYLETLQILWFIHNQGKGWSYYREKNKVPKNHVCWSANRYEAMLSLLMLQEKIPHIRQWLVPGSKLMVDFYFPADKLAVELDGGFHALEGEQKKRDKRKETILEELGIKLLRYKSEDVWKSPEGVLSDLKKHLSLV